MRKLLTAGIFGTILGIVGTGTANASIVSSGFLDEKLTEYALSTSLDLKANQSDLTALSNKIGTLPDGLTVENLYNGWKTPSGKSVYGLSIIAQHNFTTYDPLNDTINTGLKLESGGYLEVLARLFFDHGYEEPNNGVLAPFWYLTKQALRVGEIPHGKTVAGMIDEINTKIGTVPDGKNLAGMIGTLPAGYDSVGAALTAIKGIAEDAKAAALAAIPDPKQEGSSGKFVLTVDIVGDNATYRWEKIDREGETTTTTE